LGGDVLVAQGNLPEALTSFRDSLAIADRLAKADPNDAGWVADLAASHGKLGLLLERMGQRNEALAVLRKGRAPDHKLWNGYLASFDAGIARLERQAAE
jgi:tetratricopeptide (TPR) repeat protein